MCLKGIGATGLVLALLVSGCHGALTAVPAVSLTEGSGLSPKDEIDGLDAVAADGTVHVVWQERLDANGGGHGTRIIYRRGSGTPLRWGPRVLIADGGAENENPRLVATNQGVHVFAGAHLHHWLWPVGGAPIRDLGNLLGGGGPRAGRFDAVASQDGVLIVFSAPGQGGHAALQAIRWTPAGPQTPVLIAAFQDFRGVRPQLLRHGDRWIALWANNALVEYRDTRVDMMAVGLQAEIRAASSLDGGASWGGAVSVLPLASEMAGISVGSVANVPAVFIASDGLFESRLGADAWTEPVRIAAYKKGFFAGSTETSTVATAQCNGHTALAWVDARYRRSDRRLWSPLGGLPWGDDPDWDNNDLFVATDLPQPASAAAALAPLRLTVDPSMTKDIAIVERGGRLLVFRSGRARVHKAPYDAGTPPEVTQASIPCT